VTWRVRIDAALCISSGVCLGTAPAQFRLDESRRSRPVRALTEPDDQVRDAAASCPVEAILLTDADTGEFVPLDD
jgi:ferredoxin